MTHDTVQAVTDKPGGLNFIKKDHEIPMILASTEKTTREDKGKQKVTLDGRVRRKPGRQWPWPWLWL
jgi:hypothetical protein